MIAYSIQGNFMHCLLILCPAWALSFAGENPTALWLVPYHFMVSQLPGPLAWGDIPLLICFHSFPFPFTNDPNTNMQLINSVEYGDGMILIFSKNYLQLCAVACFHLLLASWHDSIDFCSHLFIKKPEWTQLDFQSHLCPAPVRLQWRAVGRRCGPVVHSSLSSPAPVSTGMSGWKAMCVPSHPAAVKILCWLWLLLWRVPSEWQMSRAVLWQMPLWIALRGHTSDHSALPLLTSSRPAFLDPLPQWAILLGGGYSNVVRA